MGSNIFGQIVNISNTSLNTCSATIYDDGGPNGDHSGTLYEMTICADNGEAIVFSVDFIDLGSFATLAIYQGTGTTGGIIYDNNTGTIGATNTASGCITITFNPIGFFSGPGFEINISCAPFPPPSCEDGILNQGEEAIDCGGPNCLACPTCDDGILNQDEIGLDCGGLTCPPCSGGNGGIIPGFCGAEVVFNGDLELTAPACGGPDGNGQGAQSEFFLDEPRAQGWYGISTLADTQPNSPDYFNSTCFGNSTVSCFGDDGSIGAYVTSGGSYAEYAQTQLLEQLETGEEYCVSLKAGLSVLTSPGGTDGFGIWFHNQGFIDRVIDGGGEQFLGAGSTLNVIPQIQQASGDLIAVSGCEDLRYCFYPDGGEQYMVVGNFRPIASTQGASNYLNFDQFSIKKTCPLDFIVDISSSNPDACDTGTSTTLTANVNDITGGCMPPEASYEWSTGETTASITLVPAPNDTYSVTVTLDADCQTAVRVAVFSCEPLPLEIISVNPVDPACTDEASGNIDLTVLGGVQPLGFEWSNGAVDEDLNNLPAGTYTVTVTDANGTFLTAEAVLNNPSLLNFSIDNVNDETCGNDDGTISLGVNGGTPDYTISWDGAATGTQPGTSGNNEVNNLNAGNYTITITDQNGCTQTDDVTIDELIIGATISVDGNVNCNSEDNGTATVTTTDGQTPFVYEWDNGETTATATMLNGGNHTVTVIDASGCALELSVNITEPSALNIALINNTDAACTSCSGTADISVSGGTTPYTYSWSSGETIEDAVMLCSGSNTVTITDANGCIEVLDLTTGSNSTLSSGGIILDNPVSCNNDCDAAITITATGGNPPYQYTWNNGQTTATQSNLCAGTYAVTIQDADGCISTDNITINNPTELSTTLDVNNPISCNGSNDGEASSTIIGGTAPFTYSWNIPGNTDTQSGLGTGTYSVTITDANGCTATNETVFTEPTAIIAILDGSTTADCIACNGTADVSISGGNPPYSFLWSSGETTEDATALCSGNNMLTITDANACSSTLSVVITNDNNFSVNINETTAISCNSACDGILEAQVAGGNAPFTYIWSDATSGSGINNLCTGNYAVTATDVNGCTSFSTYTLNEPTAINLNILFITDVSCNGNSDGSASVLVDAGGTTPFSYLWENGETNSTATALPVGTASVTVTDAAGCQAISSIQVNEPTPLSGTTTTTLVSCLGDNDGTASVQGNGGTPPYTYQWDIATGSQTSSTASNLFAGSYNVVITDANDCTSAPIEAIIGAPLDALNTTLSASDVSCFGETDGMASVNVTGGTPGYTIIWSNGINTTENNTLGIGIYTVTVTDMSGCELIDNVEITQPSPIVFDLTTEDLLCYDENTGSIIIDTVSGGAAPYVYALISDSYVPSPVFNGLAADNYTVSVQDVNGCTAIQNASLTEPNEISADLGEDITVELGDMATVNVATNAGLDASFFWTSAEELICQDSTFGCREVELFPLNNTTVTVEIVDSNGCSATDMVNIFIDKPRNIYIPNVFSPNFDGNNDVFMVYGGQGLAQIQEFRVYDRWGELIHDVSNFQPNFSEFGWAGDQRGRQVNPGVFVYYVVAEFIDGTTISYKGDVTVVK